MADDDVLPAWGAEEEMNPFDSLMWRMGAADPALRAATLSCEELDRVPDWGRFVAAHEWAVRMAPRFRQRVVEPALGLGTARWAEDPHSTCASTCVVSGCPGAPAGPSCWTRSRSST